MDFDDLDDAEGDGAEEESTSKIELAQQAGFVPSRELACIDAVFCFSDATCDEKASQTFIRRLTLPGEKKQELGSLNRIAQAALIVAGGIARNPNDLHTAFQVMSTRVSNIHFVPGAMEMHIKSDTEMNDLPKDERRYHNSLDKTKYLMSSFCKHVGVTGTPQVYNCAGEAVWVVPLVSYSAPSFDTEPDVENVPLVPIQSSKDYTDSVWPEGMSALTDDAANAMDALNDWLHKQMPEEDRAALEKVLRATPQEREAAGTRVITFSHFVPRMDLIPEKRFLPNPEMAKMVGSSALKKRVIGIKPDVHVFGRSCFGWDATLGGTRYVQAPLASLKQRIVGDTAIGDFPKFEAGEPLMLRQGQEWAAPYVAGWSEYYKSNVREDGGDKKPKADNARSKGADFAPDWVKKCIKEEKEGWNTAQSEAAGAAGFTYGRI